MQLQTDSPPTAPGELRASTSVLMCRPEHFTVSYRINPWMHPEEPTSTPTALDQWQSLWNAYRRLGFDVQLIDPIAGLPDMVYAANGAFTLDGIAYGAKFTYPQREPEGPAYLDHLERLGFSPRPAEHVNEGEGDVLLVGDVILAGHGFRTSLEAHDELRAIFDREVVSLRLVDPAFYHLDTAIAVLDAVRIAYLPRAFDAAGQAELARRFPDAITVDDADAAVLGLNSFSDGRTVVIAARAVGFERDLRAAGFATIGVDLAELLLGGGGVKCCTLELRR